MAAPVILKTRKHAMAVLRLGKEGYILGSSADIEIGKPCFLLDFDGRIIRTSSVEKYRNFSGKDLVIFTKNSEYLIKREF